MDKNTPFHLLGLLLLFSASAWSPCHAEDHPELRTYIIQIRNPKNNSLVATAAARERYCKALLPSSIRPSRLIYSYGEIFHGFAARLNGTERNAIEKVNGFIQAFPERILKLSTTHTPDYLGLTVGTGLWRNGAPGLGAGVVVGVLDSGLPGEAHPSFSDAGMPPAPAGWRGGCDITTVCSNKVIGARSFITGESVVDTEGHGSHAASTAVGSFASGASVRFLATGRAAGMAPRAHLAIYKVCALNGCPVAAIVAGMETAVSDGVDVLSLSLGGPSLPCYDDPIAIAAFGAMRRGKVVVLAAGNEYSGGISNDAPWMLTVGASTTDRSLQVTVTLGDGRVFQGESSFGAAFPVLQTPLIYPGATNAAATFCNPNSLTSINVQGKVVICQRGGGSGIDAKANEVLRVNGVAMIVTNTIIDDYTTWVSQLSPILKYALTNFADGTAIQNYARFSANPTASFVYRNAVLGTTPSPVVASFSSKGPSLQSPQVLKPDIIAPGVNILAAVPNSPFFDIYSGTSAATPHVSGIAALLKGFHPDWSPAAIKSAILTTSDIEDRSGNPIKNEHLQTASPVERGAGHVNPGTAADPGLVYDLGSDDYVKFLCGLGYTDAQVQAIAGFPVSCRITGSITESQLNYPTITVSLNTFTSVEVTRTVRSVRPALQLYTARVDAPPGVKVSVSPSVLLFLFSGHTITFKVTLLRTGTPGSWASGNLRWVSGHTVVRTPIVIAP